MLVAFGRALRVRGICGRLRRHLHLLRRHGPARPHRPRRPLLGRTHHADQPARRHRRLRRGLPRVLPGRAQPRRGAAPAHRRASTAEAEAVLQVPAVDPTGPEQEEDEALLGLVASNVETLRHKSFAACTPDELARVAPDHGADPAHPAAAPHPPHPPVVAWPPSRPAPDRAGVAADARRAGAPAVAAAPGQAAPAGARSSTSPARWPTTRAHCCSSPTRRGGRRRGWRCSASAPG